MIFPENRFPPIGSKARGHAFRDHALKDLQRRSAQVCFPSGAIAAK
jgi:hypothetical protein